MQDIIPFIKVTYLFDNELRLIHASAISTGATQSGEPCFFVTDLHTERVVELPAWQVVGFAKF
jgi:hypothetical protein